MYRIFCESYQNFLKTFDEDNYRLFIAEPFELIVDIEKYKEEKKKCSRKVLTFLKNGYTIKANIFLVQIFHYIFKFFLK